MYNKHVWQSCVMIRWLINWTLRQLQSKAVLTRMLFVLAFDCAQQPSKTARECNIMPYHTQTLSCTSCLLCEASSSLSTMWWEPGRLGKAWWVRGIWHWLCEMKKVTLTSHTLTTLCPAFQALIALSTDGNRQMQSVPLSLSALNCSNVLLTASTLNFWLLSDRSLYMINWQTITLERHSHTDRHTDSLTHCIGADDCDKHVLCTLHGYNTFDDSMYIALKDCLEPSLLLQLFLTKAFVPVHSNILHKDPCGNFLAYRHTAW